MRISDVETVLVHLVRRFHYEVDQVRAEEVVGWQAPETVDASLPESNLASGTAVRIRPGHYPATDTLRRRARRPTMVQTRRHGKRLASLGWQRTGTNLPVRQFGDYRAAPEQHCPTIRKDHGT